MSEPIGLKQVFAAKNSFSLGVKWKVKDGKITAVRQFQNRGLCFSMVCNWVKLSIQHGIEQSSKVMETTQLIQACIVHSGYNPARWQGKTAHPSTGMTDFDEEENLVYAQFGLRVAWEGDAEEWSMKSKRLSEKGSSQPAFFRIGGFGHSLGICMCPEDGCAYYFDPNYGLYEIDSVEGMKSVFEAIEDDAGGDMGKVTFWYLKLAE
jgi:hypothetical protein